MPGIKQPPERQLTDEQIRKWQQTWRAIGAASVAAALAVTKLNQLVDDFDYPQKRHHAQQWLESYLRSVDRGLTHDKRMSYAALCVSLLAMIISLASLFINR